MTSKKLPYIQWYIGDWRKDPGVQSLDYESRGIWFEILMLMHESENRGMLVLNGNAMPDSALAQILGLPEAKLKQTLSKLLATGVASREAKTGALINRKMIRTENKALEYQRLCEQRRAAGRVGGLASASKRQANAKQNSTFPSSSSSSFPSSSPVPPTAPVPSPDIVTRESKFEQFWSAYPRKRSKGAALKAWIKIKPNPELLAAILAAIERAKASKDWNKNGGDYIPNPATWLNAQGWLDEHEPEKPNRWTGLNKKNYGQSRFGYLDNDKGDEHES